MRSKKLKHSTTLVIDQTYEQLQLALITLQYLVRAMKLLKFGTGLRKIVYGLLKVAMGYAVCLSLEIATRLLEPRKARYKYLISELRL